MFPYFRWQGRGGDGGIGDGKILHNSWSLESRFLLHLFHGKALEYSVQVELYIINAISRKRLHLILNQLWSGFATHVNISLIF